MKKLLVGLTGILGSGKSAVARLLEQRGALLIDMDEAGRHVVDHDPLVQQQLSQSFGIEIFKKGQLRRKALGDIVFAGNEALARLNAIVHPAMLNRVRQQIEEAQGVSYGCCVVVDAALIFELGIDNVCDLIVVVDAPLELCLQRAEEHKHLTRTQALQRMDAQWPRDEKISRADYVLVNDASLEVLAQRVDDLFAWLVSQIIQRKK
jgi:dephospho-CoA kinase